MTLSRWQPFQELSTLRKQMDRLFEDMLSTGDRDWMGLHNMGGMWSPAVEIKETDQKIVLKAQIPGIDLKDLDVEVGEDRVTISGEHEVRCLVTPSQRARRGKAAITQILHLIREKSKPLSFNHGLTVSNWFKRERSKI